MFQHSRIVQISFHKICEGVYFFCVLVTSLVKADMDAPDVPFALETEALSSAE